MFKSERFSINWGKGATTLLLVVAIALLVVVVFNSMQLVNPSAVDIDEGSQVAWGFGIKACPLGLVCVQVDWGSRIQPLMNEFHHSPVQVAVDWGNRVAKP